MQTRTRALLALLAVTSLVISACGSDDDAGGDGGADAVDLSLVGFAVPKAGHDLAQAAFAETAVGEGISWTTSYGASGDQSRVRARVTRLTRVGFEVRVDLEIAGDETTVTLTRTEFTALRIVDGDTVWVRAVEGPDSSGVNGPVPAARRTPVRGLHALAPTPTNRP